MDQALFLHNPALLVLAGSPLMFFYHIDAFDQSLISFRINGQNLSRLALIPAANRLDNIPFFNMHNNVLDLS